MSATGDQIVSEAVGFLGDPYVYGATGPTTFDCSGLTQYVYKQLGLTLPRTSEEQYTVGSSVTVDQLEAGDLVFSAGSDGTATSPGHVGLYDGAGGVINAPHTGTVVRITPLADFEAVGYRRPSGVVDTSTTNADVLLPPPGGTQPSDPNLGGSDSGNGSLLSWPSDIVRFFSTAADDAADVGKFFSAFFQPSTYVRIGSGFFGVLFLLAGVTFLVRGAKESE
jgi:hypothetical protein